MTHQEKIEAIRKACAKANPEIVERGCRGGDEYHFCPNCSCSIDTCSTRLADVILASRSKYDTHSYDTIKDLIFNLVAFYNLRKDSLEEQSEETVAFIYDLLK